MYCTIQKHTETIEHAGGKRGSFFVSDSGHMPMMFNVAWEFNTNFCGMSCNSPGKEVEGPQFHKSPSQEMHITPNKNAMQSLQRHSRIYLERERHKIETTPRPKTSLMPSLILVPGILARAISNACPSQSLQRN